MKTHFALGLVGAPFGLKGFVKVKSYSGETDHFSRLEKITLRQDEKEETRELAEIICREDMLLMRFAGIDSPEAAARFKGAEIIAGRENAAPLKEGEYYIEDLRGLEVLSAEGVTIGHITDMLEGGGGNLAELLLLSGGKRLAPFRKEFFGDIDLKAGKIIMLEPRILEE